MSRTKMNRMGLCAALVGVALAGTSVAFAHGSNQQQAKTPEERAKEATQRFQKADKNKDGFLTHDEVGTKRWEKIKAADTNGDGKVSLAELEQARKDGKVAPHSHGAK